MTNKKPKDMGKGRKITQDEIDLRKNPINVFNCGHPDCAKLESMDFKKFKEHLSQAHKLASTQMQGKKSMMMHMDGDYWFSSTYQWTLESGLRFTQFTKMARDINDPMR